MSEIRLAGVTKSFGERQAVRGVTLTCPAHAYLCLLGPSGCGKSTLLRLIAGLEMADTGDILIGSRRANYLEPGERAVGLAFQNYALYPHLTVAGNLEFPLRAPLRRARHNATDRRDRVIRTARLLRIDHLLDRPIGTLSGGQKQRVALGRALIADPAVLLLDEPITHLDARLRYEMRAELKMLHRRLGTTTIHVTHDQQEALAVADLIAVLRDGRLEQIGAPLDLYRNPRTAFVAGFIGDPPMNLLKATAASNGTQILNIAGVEFRCPDQLAQVIDRADSPSLLLALAARDIVVATEQVPDTLRATVFSHEAVGRLVQVTARIGDDLVRLRWRPADRAPVRAGDVLALRPLLDRARVFDALSGNALD